MQQEQKAAATVWSIDRSSNSYLIKEEMPRTKEVIDRGFMAGTLPSIPCNNTEGYRRFLPKGFQPGNWDVICHHGAAHRDHVGNRRFKVCIENFLQSYQKAKSRSRRSAVITNIITSIRSSSEMGGGFVRFQPSQSLWYEIGDKVARDKVGQALRDVLRCLKRESSNGVIAESAGTPTLNQQDQSDVPQMEEKEPTSITDNSSFTDSSSSDTFNESKPCAQSSSVTIAEHTGTWTRQKRSLSTATLGSMPPTTRPVHSYKKTKLDPDETCKSPRLNNDKLLPRKSLPVHAPNWKLQQDCISVLHQWKDPCPAAISFPRTNNPPDCFGAYDRDSDGLFEWFMNDV